jgi:L-ascorbate metabolism protein UlaG (beta-lactamase superfamily)
LTSFLALTLAAGLSVAAEKALRGDRLATSEGDLILHPINHATLALGWKASAIFVDPVGGAKKFADLPRPDLILITDIHFDHLSVETLKALAAVQTKLVAPPAAAEQLPADLRQQTTVLTNGQSATVAALKIEAVAAYNTTAERAKFHAKGRGNGYVLAFADKRVYVSGDTEDVPEMRALKNIDVAFVCMNLPYTMTVEQAANAVGEFRPKVVYPYHCRGSDLEKFKRLVGEDAGVEVRIRDWYQP